MDAELLVIPSAILLLLLGVCKFASRPVPAPAAVASDNNFNKTWSIQKYISISPETNFKTENSFANKDENPELLDSNWDFNFREQNGISNV